MGYLLQDSSSMDDCTALTISFWLNMPSPGYIFQFGGPGSDPLDNSPSIIRIRPSGDGTDGDLVIVLESAIAVYPASPFFPGVSRAELISGNGALLGARWFNRWHHIIIAAQIQPDGTFGTYNPLSNPGGTKSTVLIRMDGVPVGATGEGQNAAVYLSGDISDGIGIKMQNRQIGLPFVPASFTDFTPPPSIKIRYADFQAWFGTFIDPNVPDNFAKFVTLTDGGTHGTNVKPSIAAASFGPQSILFTGGGNRFYTNRGTGGAFTKTGTINNFSGPGF